MRGSRIAKALLRSLDAVLDVSSPSESPWYVAVDEFRIGAPRRETSLVVGSVAPLGIRRARLPLLVGGLSRSGASGPRPSPSETARDLIRALADRHPRRRLHVIVGAGLAASTLRDLPASVTVTVRMPGNAVVHGLTPPKTGRRGRPRRQGDRLGSLSELAASGGFREIHTAQGRRAVKSMTAQWYSVFAAQPVQIVLVRLPASGEAFDIALASTDLEAGAEELLGRYESVHQVGTR